MHLPYVVRWAKVGTQAGCWLLLSCIPVTAIPCACSFAIYSCSYVVGLQQAGRILSATVGHIAPTVAVVLGSCSIWPVTERWHLSSYRA